ncbi:MAG: alanine racemase [Gammaproteobacteria bacterium]|nr:alanine racemase [Gammaproteobacteria bacterium]
MTRSAVATLDVGAFQHNLKQVRKLAPNSKIMAVIKANGYGHGLLRVARNLADADAFGVAKIEEAIYLREAGMTQRILLLQGFADRQELKTLAQWRIDSVIHHMQQVEILEGVALTNPIDVWAKLDTGMHRLGFDPVEFNRAWDRLRAMSTSNIANCFAMSHFANADRRNDPVNRKQIDMFHEYTQDLVCEKSMANSAGLLAMQESHMDWVRPGVMLYGISPFADTWGDQFELLPVMTLASQVIAIKTIGKGDTVGYGGHWQAERDTQIAVVGIGYGDGYPRHAENGTPVLIGGLRYPLVGRVSMDSLCVNLGMDHDVMVGDKVILWGDGLPVEEIAGHAHTIPYELVCRVTSRVRFVEQ